MRTKFFKTAFILIGIFLLFLPLLAKNQLWFEYENLQTGWSPRLGILLEPRKNIHLFLRKGIGGPDPAFLVGYDFPLGHLVVSPYFGINTDDNLNLVYVRPELSLFAGYKSFRALLIPSIGIPVSNERKYHLYTLGKFWLQFDRVSIGIMTDLLLLEKKYKESFWRIGPCISYTIHQNVDFTSWMGWEHVTGNYLVRVGLSINL